MRLTIFVLSIAVLVLSALLFVKAHPANATGPSPDVALSHFQCYAPTAQGQPPPPPRNVVTLTDQFQSYTTQVGPAVLLCTPTKKQLQHGVHPLPVPPPVDHLECYMISGPPINHVVLASNQLQKQNLMLGQPQLLCVPTNKKVISR